MNIEIKTAINFILSYLYDKLPRRRVNLFGEELEKCLEKKLILTDFNASNTKYFSTAKLDSNSTFISSNLIDHLSEENCLNFNKNQLIIDDCFIIAANESALDLKEILFQLPDYLKVFIETGLVAYILVPPPCISSHLNRTISINANQLDLNILYKHPQINLSSLVYTNDTNYQKNFRGNRKYINIYYFYRKTCKLPQRLIKRRCKFKIK